MRRFLHLSTLCFAAGAAYACKGAEVIDEPVPPTAAVRFVNAVPDTGLMDFRAVDGIDLTVNFYNVAFRGTGLLYYKNAIAGTREFKIFRTPASSQSFNDQVATATTVVADLTGQVLEEGKRYTYVLWGLSRTGSTPAMKVTQLVDDPADPGNQVAIRVVNACVPGLCGGAADGTVDVRAFTSAQTINAPAATFTSVAPLTASAYVNVPVTAGYTLDVRAAGGVTTGAAIASGTAPAGIAQTVDLEAVPGTNVAGSAITVFVFPRNLAGSQATTPTAPSVIFVWDRRPPRTCALCVAPIQ